MLKNILSGSECAECRICCVFDKYDIWETPVITNDLKAKINEDYPDTEFISKGNSYLFRMREDDDELYYCPMLDKQTGCRLGDNKPFDCRIWPYRVMNFGGKRVISIASICPSLYKKPLSELVYELDKNGLANIIFEYADENPDIVKEYQKGYPILITE